MNRQVASHLWILSGPIALMIALILLIGKTAHHIERPVWLFGLSLSILIACFIAYLTFKEILSRETLLSQLKEQNEKKAAAIRSALDESQHLFREKVDKLEEALKALEEDYRQLQVGYEKIYGENQKEHTLSSSLHVSLEDALDDLREERQKSYIKTQAEHFLPPDLIAKHRQLREQFDEKALILDQTRRRLFQLEGHLFAARKIQAEEKLERGPELEILLDEIALFSEKNRQLEEENNHLEEVISSMLESKAKKAPAKKKAEALELQF